MLNRLAFFSRKAFEVSALVLRLPQTPLSLLSFLPTSPPTLLPELTFLLLLSASETTLGFLSVTASSSAWSSLLFPSVAAYRSGNKQAIMRLQSTFNHFQINDVLSNFNPKQTCTNVQKSTSYGHEIMKHGNLANAYPIILSSNYRFIICLWPHYQIKMDRTGK